MTEELLVGPEQRRSRAPVMVIALVGLVAVAVVMGAWLVAPRDPSLTLDEVRSAYRQQSQIDRETARWDFGQFAARDWAMATREASRDCSRLTDGSGRLDASPFAVTLRSTSLSGDEDATVFSGHVTTGVYRDVAAASLAMDDVRDLLDRCHRSASGLMRGCLVHQTVVRPVGPDARVRLAVNCSDYYSNTDVTDLVQVGNTLTMIEPDYGVGQDAVDRTADLIRRSLQDV